MKVKISNITKKMSILYIGIFLSVVIYQATGNSILASIIVLPGLLYAFIKAYNNIECALWLLFMLSIDFWGLVPFISIGNGLLHWYDFNAVLSLILFFKYHKNFKFYKYGTVYIIMLIFIGVACVTSYKLYDQSVFTTLLTGRALFCIFSFWPITSFIKSGKFNKEKFLLFFEKFVKVTLVLYWATWLFENLGLHITVLQTGIRWGTRLYIDPIFIMLFYFLNVYRIIYGKELLNRRHEFIYAAISFFTIVIVAQARTAMFFMMIVTLILLIISNRPKKIILYSILAIVIAIGLMSIPTIRSTVISSVIENNSDSGNVAVRMISQNYFENKLVGNEIFGVGIPNNHDIKAIEYSGKYTDMESKKYNYYYLEDLGAFSIRYQFGIIAYILYFIFLILAIINTVKKRKSSSFAFMAAGFFIYMLLNSEFLQYITYRPFGFMLAVVFAEVSSSKDTIIMRNNI